MGARYVYQEYDTTQTVLNKEIQDECQTAALGVPRYSRKGVLGIKVFLHALRLTRNCSRRAKCVLLQNGLSKASKLAGTSAAEHVLVSSDTRDSCEQIRIFCVMQWKMANKGDRDEVIHALEDRADSAKL